MIDFRNIIFNYGEKRVLDRISGAIDRGSVTALVGPNGAGKTTLIRCMIGLYEPLDGTVLFDGQDVHRNSHAAHRRMGYLTDFFGVYEQLTAERCLIFAARAHDIPETEVAARVADVAAQLSLTDHLATLAGELSRGLRQRLAIGQTIIHKPDFVVMDEPASGLDPEARKELSRLLRILNADGLTILVSSHILAELEDYCSDMLVMRDGRIIETASLSDRGGSDRIRFRLQLASPDAEIAAKLGTIDGVSGVEIDDLSATFLFAGDALAQQQLLRHLIETGAPIRSFAESDSRLQDAYFSALSDDRMTGT